MTITITKAGVAAWVFAAISAVLLTTVLLLTVLNDAQYAHISTLQKQVATVTAERDALSAEVARLKKLGSAPLGSAHGGIIDSFNTGKDALAICTGLLVLTKAETSDDRYDKFVAVMNSIAAKSDSKLIDLIAAHGTNPSKETFKPLLDFGLQK